MFQLLGPASPGKKKDQRRHGTSWVNAAAPMNILRMFVTELVFQLPMGWLNAAAPQNIPYMFVTELVFQLPMGWLNAVAP